jgi:hypothetical protein
MKQSALATATGREPMVGGRYRIDAPLGRGGMGVVYAATDATNGERLALKRVRADAGERAELEIAQFRREYELLAELSHPSIIRVYDYGVDEAGPYYTMELLDGASLGERGELHWSEACRLLRDVASSLAVLHARRLVHRDVTLRNIHCTRAGRCKLIDFGAVTRMGSVDSVVGTPPYLPPEALDGRALDARADLFALGAALYRLLTGRHAYPAATIDELHSHWRVRPRSPHELVRDVPVELSHLTMAMLCLDPLGRPDSAAEVMDRLSALSGLDLREPGAVRRAFLSSPALVGRAHALQLVRVFLARAAERDGVLAISGPLGVGRTRVLEACMTQAQLAGITTLHARGSDAQEAYGLLRALATSASNRLPDAEQGPAARHVSELFAALPARRSMRAAALPDAEPAGSLEPFESTSLRSERQSATRDCFAALCRRGPLLVAIDDLDRADEPSVACLAALMQEPSVGPLLLAFAVASDRPARARVAIEWLCSLGTRCELAALSRPEVLELLSSVFGTVPNVAVLADRIHALSGGMPQWAMQLAEQLVERGIVHYEAGTFVVPERLQLDELPNTLKDVSRARLASVSAEARELACAFMIDADAWYAASELAAALGSTVACVEPWLDELVSAGIVVREGARTGLDRRAWLGSSLALDESRARAKDWHARLAQLFAARGDRERQAQHAWAAGDRRAAVLTLVEHCEALYRGLPSDPSLLDRVIAGMPSGFLDLLCAAIETCGEFGLSKRAELMLRIACLRIATPINDPRALSQARSLLAQLRVDAGLEAWEQLAHVTDANERLTRALAETQARYERAPEAERCCPVSEAIRVLSAVRGHAVGICSQARDFELFALLPSLAPLVPLSPTLGMTQDLTATVGHLMAGRYQRAEAGYLKIIEQLDGPIGAAIDPTGHRFNRFGSYYPLGTLAADRGQEAALRWADKLESELLFEVPAWRIRMMFHRARGDSEEAERCRRRVELLRIAQRPHEMYGAGVVASELFYCIAIEDLIGIRRIVDELEALVARFPAWQPVLEHARGEYYRLRGNPTLALEHFESALAASVCGTDSLWQGAAAACLSSLFALGRYEEGRTRGRAWLEAAAAADLCEGANTIVARLSLIEAALGDAAAATGLADSILHWNEAQQITGIRAGLAHETRARVAMLLGDRGGFDQHLAHCAHYFRSGKNPALCARYERIVRDARALGIRSSEPPPEANGSAPVAGAPVALRRRVRTCADAQQRADVLLEALARECSASSGALYIAQDSVMELRAIYGAHEPRAELDAAIERFCERAATRGPAPDRAHPHASDEQTMDAPLAFAEAERDLPQTFLLTQQTEREVLLLGVALLRGEHKQRLQLSSETLSLCAELLLEAGDASAVPMR